MSNSIITILNLACIKHTGCPLPSSLLGTDWKYIEDDCFQPRPTCPQRKRFAVWDPSPYSYPLKEVMPTDDPEHKILRNIVVDELKEIAANLQTQANQYREMAIKAQGGLEVILQMIPKQEVEKMIAQETKVNGEVSDS